MRGAHRPSIDAAAAVARGAVRPDRAAAEMLRHTSFAQPAMFAVEMGLARLWQSWGIEPDVVLGHSVGQYAAACVAGVFSLEDGARLIAERGRLFGSLPAGGRMVAVFADPEDVERAADPDSRGFRSLPTTAPTRCCPVPATISSRSSPAPARTAPAAPGWRPRTPSIRSCSSRCSTNSNPSQAQFDYAVPTLPLVCNRTGAVLTTETPLDARYWRRHSRQPVQFTESVARWRRWVLGADGDRPAADPDRRRAADLARTAAPPRAIVSLRKGAGAQRQITDALAAAYVSGHRPDFAHAAHPRRRPARTAHLSVPAPPLLAQDQRAHQRRCRRCAVSGILGSAKDLASGDSSTAPCCRSRPSRGWPTTSSTAPSSFPGRPTPRWRWPRPAHRRGFRTSSSTSRSSCRRRPLARCS